MHILNRRNSDYCKSRNFSAKIFSWVIALIKKNQWHFFNSKLLINQFIKSKLTFNWMPALNEYNRCWTILPIEEACVFLPTVTWLLRDVRGVSLINGTILVDCCTSILLGSCQKTFAIYERYMYPNFFLTKTSTVEKLQISSISPCKQHATYRICLNFGDNFNMAIWRIRSITPNLNAAKIINEHSYTILNHFASKCQIQYFRLYDSYY